MIERSGARDTEPCCHGVTAMIANLASSQKLAGVKFDGGFPPSVSIESPTEESR